jgi:hypothetical protein
MHNLWNNLPLGLQSAISINAFKQQYKRTFFVNHKRLLVAFLGKKLARLMVERGVEKSVAPSLNL